MAKYVKLCYLLPQAIWGVWNSIPGKGSRQQDAKTPAVEAATLHRQLAQPPPDLRCIRRRPPSHKLSLHIDHLQRNRSLASNPTWCQNGSSHAPHQLDALG